MKKTIIAVVLVICLMAFSLPALASTCGTGSCLQTIGYQTLAQCQQGQCSTQLQGLFGQLCSGTGCSSGSIPDCLGALTNCNGAADCLGSFTGCNVTSDCLKAITGCTGAGCFSGLAGLFQ